MTNPPKKPLNLTKNIGRILIGLGAISLVFAQNTQSSDNDDFWFLQSIAASTSGIAFLLLSKEGDRPTP